MPRLAERSFVPAYTYHHFLFLGELELLGQAPL